MLRIQRSEENTNVVLTLSGRINAEHLTELQSLIAAESGVPLVLDVTEVNLVDREAVKFLAGCEADGITLRNCHGYIGEWILTEKQRRTSGRM